MSHSEAQTAVLIVIPTLGQRLEYLQKTLESIKKQSYKKYDVVLIYPLKNAAVSKLAKQYNATSVEDTGSLSSALNAGIKKAKKHHKYISWIGDDDLLTENSLEDTVKALEENPSAPVAFGNCIYIDSNDQEVFISKAGKIAPWLMSWGPNLLPCPGSLFRKSALDTAGEFDENNKYSMDLEMFLRLKKLGRFSYVNKNLASFRWHSDSMSVASRSAATKEAEEVKRKFTPRILRPLTPLWFIPTRVASLMAAKKLSQH